MLKALCDGYAQVLADQRQILRTSFEGWQSHEVDTQGNAFFVELASARDAVSAATAVRTAGALLRIIGGSHSTLSRKPPIRPLSATLAIH